MLVSNTFTSDVSNNLQLSRLYNNPIPQYSVNKPLSPIDRQQGLQLSCFGLGQREPSEWDSSREQLRLYKIEEVYPDYLSDLFPELQGLIIDSLLDCHNLKAVSCLYRVSHHFRNFLSNNIDQFWKGYIRTFVSNEFHVFSCKYNKLSSKEGSEAYAFYENFYETSWSTINSKELLSNPYFNPHMQWNKMEVSNSDGTSQSFFESEVSFALLDKIFATSMADIAQKEIIIQDFINKGCQITWGSLLNSIRMDKKRGMAISLPCLLQYFPLKDEQKREFALSCIKSCADLKIKDLEYVYTALQLKKGEHYIVSNEILEACQIGSKLINSFYNPLGKIFQPTFNIWEGMCIENDVVNLPKAFLNCLNYNLKKGENLKNIFLLLQERNTRIPKKQLQGEISRYKRLSQSSFFLSNVERHYGDDRNELYNSLRDSLAGVETIVNNCRAWRHPSLVHKRVSLYLGLKSRFSNLFGPK